MRRVLLIAMGVLLVVCVACVGLGYFVALPKVQNAVADDYRDAVSTAIAQHTSQTLDGGEIVISDAELSTAIGSDLNGSSVLSVDSAQARILPAGVQIVLTTDRGNVTWFATVAAANGRLDVTKIDVSDANLRYLFPTSKMERAIEDGVNGALDASDLRLTEIALIQGRMTLTTEAGP